jgi:hypothetical protein
MVDALGNKTGGRQKGTPNKDKPFRDALRAALDEGGEERITLGAIAHALLTQAVAGNAQAIREVADRLDGKVPQAIGGVDENDNLTPLTAAINMFGRPGSSPPPKAVGGVRKPGKRGSVRRRSGRR